MVAKKTDGRPLKEDKLPVEKQKLLAYRECIVICYPFFEEGVTNSVLHGRLIS